MGVLWGYKKKPTKMDIDCSKVVDNNDDEPHQTNIIYSDKIDSNHAKIDPTMAQDPRVISNLLALERTTMPECEYFRHLQRDIQPFMRKVVTTWMLEVGIFFLFFFYKFLNLFNVLWKIFVYVIFVVLFFIPQIYYIPVICF